MQISSTVNYLPLVVTSGYLCVLNIRDLNLHIFTYMISSTKAL